MKENWLEWLREGNISIPSVLLSSYKQIGLVEEELVLLLHVISFLEKGNDFPTPNDISSRMTISLSQCTDLLRRLIQKGFIQIIDGNTADGIRFERYSIEPLWEKLIDNLSIKKQEKNMELQQKEETNLYTCFEQEFGRPLSPFECETLAMWMDDDRHDPIIIKAALRESVISGKLNFRYIDRILFEWKKNGIRTIEQAKSYGQKVRQHQTVKRPAREDNSAPKKSVPFYNWLEQ